MKSKYLDKLVPIRNYDANLDKSWPVDFGWIGLYKGSIRHIQHINSEWQFLASLSEIWSH